MKHFLICLCLLCLSISRTAQMKVWDGGAETNAWSESKNWNPDGVPASGDSVIISDSTVIVDIISPTIKSLLLLDDAELTISPSASLVFSGSLSYAIRAESSMITNNGTIEILDVGSSQAIDRAIDLCDGSNFINNGTCDILQTNGYGIRLESASTAINSGDITIHNEYVDGISVRDPGGLFTNNHNITITNDGINTSGIATSALGGFDNTGVIDIVTVSGTNNNSDQAGLKVFGGQLTNTGIMNITVSSGGSGLRCLSSASKINLISGTLDIQLSHVSADGVKASRGSLTIESGATLKVSGTPWEYLMDIKAPAVFECNGVLDLDP